MKKSMTLVKKYADLYFLLILIMANLAFSQALSKNCIDELLAVQDKKKDFNLQNFLTKDLPTEVVKVKAQMKLPFGKPKDDKVTDIGVTVGCLKGFPENPGQIQTMLKDVSLEMAKLGTNKLGVNALAGAQGQSLLASAQYNGTTSIVSGIIPAKIFVEPALKECNVEFNSDDKFCYDGGVYDKCDGMLYNPTTHICTEGVANRAACNRVQYNPLTQKCENNAVLSLCGETIYNPQTHSCKDDTLFEFPKCGETAYNPETHGCGENQTLLTKCGANIYNPLSHGCGEDNAVYPKCGANLYNSETHICKSGTVVAKQSVIEEVSTEIVASKQQKSKEIEIEETKESEKITNFGIRANIGLATADASGLSIGTGAFVLIPFYSVYFVPGISYNYREPYIDHKIMEKAIDIPLLFRFRYSEENIVYLGIGALLGFVLSSEIDNESKYYYSRNILDFGIAAELGFRVSDNFSIDIRWLSSFTPDYKYLYDYSSSYNYYNSSIISSSLYQFQIGMSYLF